MNYDLLTRLHPKVLDIVHRDPPFWEGMHYRLEKEKTQLHTLALVTDGAGLFELDHHCSPLTPGVVFQIWPGCQMNITTTAEQTLSFISFHFLYQLLQWEGTSARPVECREPLPFPAALTLPSNTPVPSMFEHALFDWREKSAGYEWHAHVNITNVLAQLSRFVSRETEEEHPAASLVSGSIEYMKKHYSEDISRDRLAALLSVSPGYFSTAFKKHTGYSPIQYLTKIRLDAAKHLLRTTKLSIAEIAERTGFTDSFYFARIFGRETGLSPRDYRKG